MQNARPVICCCSHWKNYNERKDIFIAFQIFVFFVLSSALQVGDVCERKDKHSMATISIHSQRCSAIFIVWKAILTAISPRFWQVWRTYYVLTAGASMKESCEEETTIVDGDAWAKNKITKIVSRHFRLSLAFIDSINFLEAIFVILNQYPGTRGKLNSTKVINFISYFMMRERRTDTEKSSSHHNYEEHLELCPFPMNTEPTQTAELRQFENVER